MRITLRHHEFISVDAGLGFGFGGLEVAATNQIAYQDLTTTKAKAPSSKHAPKKMTTASTPVTTISPFNTPLSNKSRLTSPLGILQDTNPKAHRRWMTT
jgi:hypothetical protein